MSEGLRLLVVEDSESDAALLIRLLERAGYRVKAERVDDAAGMRAALVAQTWDVVIADYHVPQFEAPASLGVLRESGLDIPFLVVSGAMGENVAVAMMKAGAHDYLLKDHLARLPPAVEREIREARVRADRRRTEESLRLALIAAEEREQQLAAIFTAQTEAVLVYDASGMVIRSNPAASTLFGFQPTGVGIEEIIERLGLRAGAESLASRRALRGETVTGVLRTVHGRNIETSSAPMWDAEGKIAGAVTIARDITERMKVEAQLAQAQKMEMVGRLAGGVAHDFNNLLTVINGYSSLVLRQLPVDDPRHELMAEVTQAGERAAKLTSHLLVLSRKQMVETREVNVNELIIEVGKMVGRVIGEHIRLELVLNPATPRVLADPGQIHQVLMNLVINARDAMPDGGTLLIETENIELNEELVAPQAEVKAGRYVLVTVSDTGVGMSKEVMAHLFEPFFSTKEAGRGTGLGLATVYSIVSQSGGSIRVLSEPMRGTSFQIFLPISSRPGETAQGEEPKREPQDSIRGAETILVVEDQEQLRGLAARVLRDLGYIVHVAPNGTEALELASAHSGPIHLLLTDVVMPGMSGKELADQLKPQRPGMEILFMSGYSGGMLDRRMLGSAGAYLAKPFSPGTLALKVREALDRSRGKGTAPAGSESGGVFPSSNSANNRPAGSV